jgi:rfaE bifunctional protein nucleotidyltransferase chain/domain
VSKLDAIEIQNVISAEKAKGKVIILGCGCFEIFHIGHLEYLEEAKKHGDILAIGINTDDYIRRHKLREPIFDIDQRMQVIYSIKPVDYVFSFNEDTFDRSIEIIKPDYFIKGIDRALILEEETCNKYSVKILRVGTIKKYSSTQLLEYFH